MLPCRTRAVQSVSPLPSTVVHDLSLLTSAGVDSTPCASSPRCRVGVFVSNSPFEHLHREGRETASIRRQRSTEEDCTIGRQR